MKFEMRNFIPVFHKSNQMIISITVSIIRLPSVKAFHRPPLLDLRLHDVSIVSLTSALFKIKLSSNRLKNVCKTDDCEFNFKPESQSFRLRLRFNNVCSETILPLAHEDYLNGDLA